MTSFFFHFHPLNLTKNSLFYDLKYITKHSAIKHWAMQKNCGVIADGFGMLVEQAAESFFLWTGHKPTTNLLLARGDSNSHPR